MAELTPMMQQYMDIKKDNPDSLLFYRLGDFYEMFGDDARTASKELDLVLTTRDRSKDKNDDDRTPMCGVPYHSAEAYISRLIAKGYHVSLCEQIEDPRTAKGLVKRDVVRTITPGTVLDEACLDSEKSNYLCAIYYTKTGIGLAACDLSTGQAQLTCFTGDDRQRLLINELGRFSPVETVTNNDAFDDVTLAETLMKRFNSQRRLMLNFVSDPDVAEALIRRQFGDEAFEAIPADSDGAIPALDVLLNYLHKTQKSDLTHLDKLQYYRAGSFMVLDVTARRNLELTETLRSKEKKGSLLSVIDKTRTPMGARTLRSWLQQPLLDVTAIDRRLNVVEALVDGELARQELRLALNGIGDIERLIGRISYGTAGGRELVALRYSLERLPSVHGRLANFSAPALKQMRRELDTLEDIAARIAVTLVDEPPVTLREGKLIRDGFNEQVDHFRSILSGGKGFIAELEAREREKTGIRTLKVGYNKVFGYYIEVSNSFRDQVPPEYIRKQTLVNGERYITQELKDLESEVLTASERDAELEYQLFTELRNEVAAQVARIQVTASQIAQLDTLCALAETASRNHYCRPVVDESNVIEIQDGRHPVVEVYDRRHSFVPNDTHLNVRDERVSVITGPNMAGKSTYMRQVALIVLLAQIGSFVPAKSAHIGVVDRIFTRIGASDDLSSGQSTFMIEMMEVSELLRCATRNSLLILDEIGRGTSTFDGMSIARAVVEHCARKLKARTLFATHYHELTALEQELPTVRNYNVAVQPQDDGIIFLRKIVPGGADRSYGIEVAKLAGVPEGVLKRARVILHELESEAGRSAPAAVRDDQISLTDMADSEVADTIRNLQVDAMTPLQALQTLYTLKDKLT